MTANRWADIERLYHAARERAPQDRAAFLDEACAGDEGLRREVESLLANETAAGGFLEGTALSDAAQDLASESTASRVPSIAGYTILKTLGEGGMGVVYLAEQVEPIRRLVALKLIKHGMDSRHVVARFEAERQALAMMRHPHIAAVFDAGTTADGRPYFVMEYVEGVPITDYCDQQQLSTRARLELFLQVCAALQHAHQKGVIHRDLKPSNILVSNQDGQALPKVIDFGIAKAVDSAATARTAFTEHGMMVGTPEYMSPEQAALSPDIDTATDVYSLGVVLYELLVGALPFDAKVLRAAGYDEMRRMIREDDPPKPSTRLTGTGESGIVTAAARKTDAARLAKQLKGDLDLIALKALEKDRHRRYDSIATFAADIARYLADEPVAVRPPSAAYRVRKFARRYRAAVIGAAAVFLMLLAGAAVSTILYFRAESQRRDADRLRIQADEQRTAAESAAREADVQRTAALAATGAANDARLIADREAAAAIAARREAEYRAYVATIGAADGELRVGLVSAARARLLAVPVELRAWEWQHLFFKTDTSLATRASTGPCGSTLNLSLRELYPRAVSGNVLALAEGASRIYLRRCATLEVWDKLVDVRSAYQLSGPVLAVGPAGTALVTEQLTSRGALTQAWMVVLVDPVTRRSLNRLGPYPAAPICASVSRDGARLAMGFRPRSSPIGEPLEDFFDVWDLRSEQRLVRLAPPRPPLFDTRALTEMSCMVAFTPDATRLATSGSRVHAWQLDSGIEIAADPAQAGTAAQPIAWNADGTRLAIGRHTGLVDILNVTTAPTLQRLDGNGFIRVLPMPDGARRLLVPDRSRGQVLTIAFSPNGALVLTGIDGGVGVWNVEQGRLTQVLSGHTSPVIGVAVDAAGHILSADADGQIKVWRGSTSGAITRVPDSFRPAGVFTLSADGTNAALAQMDGGVSVWRLADLRQTVVRIGSGQLDLAKMARSLAIAPDASRLLVAELDAVATVRAWDLQSNATAAMPTLAEKPCQPLVPTSPPFFADKMAVSPDGQSVAYRQGRCVIVRNLSTMEILATLHEYPLTLAFRPDGVLLVTAGVWPNVSGAASMVLWDWRRNIVRARVPMTSVTGNSNISNIVVSKANGSVVAVLETPNLVSFWKVDVPREIGRRIVPPTQHVALSPDGRRLASAGADNTVRIWDVDRGKLLLILTDDDRPSGGIAFTPDGRLIAGRSSGGLTIWETKAR